MYPTKTAERLVFRIHNSKFAGHLRITKTAHKSGELVHIPNFVEYLANYVKACLSCLQVKPVRQTSLRPPLQSVALQQSLPGDMLKVDLIGKLQTSGGYTHILTAIDVFSRHISAIPLRTASAESVAKALFQIFLTLLFARKCQIWEQFSHLT